MRRAPILRNPLLAAALAVAAPAGALLGQGRGREGYTHLSYAGPDVSLVSAAEEDSAARANAPVLAGDVLVTGKASRAEAVLADGTVVRLDVRSELRFERLARTYESDDDRTVLALARGSVAVEVRDFPPRDAATRLDTDDATILSPTRSHFRVDTGHRGTEIYVLSGRVEVRSRGGRAVLGSGDYAFVAGDDEIEAEPAEVPRDRFTRFVDERRARATESEAARHVGSDYAYDAAALEGSGSWTWVRSSGTWGWRPDVGPDWTPYSLGTWRWTPAGLTWVSYEAWGWLPYHYGTWVYDEALGWVWIPADSYSPAWVAWSYGDDWTGWCPVGWGGAGYAPAYPRSTRTTRGSERGGAWNTSPRGKVEVKEIDRRGWNFVPTARLGKAVRETIRRGAPPERERRPAREAALPRPAEGWRSASTPAGSPVERRGAPPRDASGDTGWRAPSPRVIERTTEKPPARREEAPARRESPVSSREAPVRAAPPQAPARHEPVRSAPAPVAAPPVHHSPPPAPMHVSAPAPAAAPAPDRHAASPR